MTAPTIMFAGGGTGGHIYPGIAVADCWQKKHPKTDPVFVGCGREIEKKILAETNYVHEVVPFESPRKLLRHPIKFYRSWEKSRKLACSYLVKYQPKVVIGLGGYASYPVVREAARKRLPIILLEQNVVPGLATNHLFRFATLLCTSYDTTHDFFSEKQKIITTGNPVREEITELAKQITIEENRGDKKPTLLIQGGSQGSDRINLAMLNFIKEHAAALREWRVRHQTGVAVDSEITQQLISRYQAENIDADVQTYFSAVSKLYESVELTICRAGGTTLAEVQALNIPAIVIPIANSMRNHQYKNATEHANTNHSSVVQEDDKNFQKSFSQAVLSYLIQSQISADQSSKNKAMSTITPASKLIVQEIEKLIAS